MTRLRFEQSRWVAHPIWRGVASLLLCAGVLGSYVLWMGTVLSIVGALLTFMIAKFSLPVPVSVRIGNDELRVGKRSFRRKDIVVGYLVPRGARGARVRLVRRGFRSSLVFDAPNERKAQALLGALGLDAVATAVSFRVRHAGSQLTLLLPAATLAFIGWVLLEPSILPPLALLAVVLGAQLVPANLRIGTDGLLLSWLWQKHFIPFGLVSKASRYVLERRDGPSSAGSARRGACTGGRSSKARSIGCSAASAACLHG